MKEKLHKCIHRKQNIWIIPEFSGEILTNNEIIF